MTTTTYDSIERKAEEDVEYSTSLRYGKKETFANFSDLDELTIEEAIATLQRWQDGASKNGFSNLRLVRYYGADWEIRGDWTETDAQMSARLEWERQQEEIEGGTPPIVSRP